MKQTLKKLASIVMAFGTIVLLAGCGGGCGHEHRHMNKHRMHGNQPQPQEVIVYEAEAMEVIEMPAQNTPVMVAKMHTRSANGGTSEMGTIKFMPGENGVKMMVDLIDLRPGKDYTVKIYPCGKCKDFSCCASKCMNLNLPMLSVDEPGRLIKTFDISGVTCKQLKNAKIVLMRDGGYKAAWGRVK